MVLQVWNSMLLRFGLSLLCVFAANAFARGDEATAVIDPGTIRGKVMCGYQGWFRCPSDAQNAGWIHWSRDGRKIAPNTLTFDLWPDVREFAEAGLCAAPGFTHPDGRQAYLYSADDAAIVLRHFQWMRDFGIDGAWLQHFAVDFPGQRSKGVRYPSRLRVMHHVREAARQTGRVWGLTYDVAGLPTENIYDAVTSDWKRLVDDGMTKDPRYLHEAGRPVVQIYGFYFNNKSNFISPEVGNKLIDFFKAPGPYSAFLYGGGDWNWRRVPDPAWQAMFKRFDAYAPWNVGNITIDSAGIKHATTNYWRDDRAECERNGCLWTPVVYPGFSWDNLQKLTPGSSIIPRRKGQFLWEQFHVLSEMKQTTVYVAMFDEVDEGTAIYKIAADPPTQAHFVDLEGMASDWYLRLVGQGTKMLRDQSPISAEIPIKP